MPAIVEPTTGNVAYIRDVGSNPGLDVLDGSQLYNIKHPSRSQLMPGIIAPTWVEWTGSGSPGADKVYFQRIYIPGGIYDRMQCGITGGPNPSRYIDMGIYADDGGNPPRPTGPLLQNTGKIATASSDRDKFWTKALTASLTVTPPITAPPATDAGVYYWLALVVSSASIKLMGSYGSFHEMWGNRFIVVSDNYGDTLGVLPESFEAEKTAAVYLAILQQGVDDMDGV